MSKDTTETAFPVNDIHHSSTRPGMTLRDYFAGQALTGLIAQFAGTPLESQASESQLARWAYTQADEMLKARDHD